MPVTSVGIKVPDIFLVSNSPIFSNGDLTLTLNDQLANLVFAGPPADGKCDPVFRKLINKDLPIVDNAHGGTGLDTSSAANGTLLIGNGSGFTLATLTAGSNITITNSAGGITISSTGGGGGGGPVSPHTASDSALTVAAGATGTMDSTQISSGKTGQLYAVNVGGSVAFRVDLYTVLNGVQTQFETGYGWEGKYDWKTPAAAFITVTEDPTVGLDGFRVVVTNLDTTEPADFYATFYWDEV